MRKMMKEEVAPSLTESMFLTIDGDVLPKGRYFFTSFCEDVSQFSFGIHI